jgi:Fe-S cluster biogenesis protein NfuA
MDSKNKHLKSTLFVDVAEVIELIRPSIQADGGDIKFLGACIGCPSLYMTLQGGIESTLKERVKGVTIVKAVE